MSTKAAATEVDARSVRSRRTVLGALVGTIGAFVANGITRPAPAAAAGDGTHVELGGANSDTTVTSITNTTDGGAGFEGYGTGLGTGVFGQSTAGCGVKGRGDQRQGVWGVSYWGPGVLGESVQPTGAGVTGGSNFGWGVFAYSSGGKPAISGWSKSDNAGVVGHSGTADPPAGPSKTGIYGIATQDANARGVTGETTIGRGVNGIATSGTGVYGKATTGEGMHAESTGSNGVAGYSGSGIASGVYGENTAGGLGVMGKSTLGVAVGANTQSGIAVNALAESGGTAVATYSIGGTALQVTGRATFSNAGLAPVAVGAKTRVIGVATGLTPASVVLTTLESNQPGLLIQRVTKNVETETFKVFLSAAVASGKTAKIGWFVIG